MRASPCLRWRGHGDLLRCPTRSHEQRNKLLRCNIRHEWRSHERHLHLLDWPLPPEAADDESTTSPQPVFDRRHVAHIPDTIRGYPPGLQRGTSPPMDDDHDGKLSSTLLSLAQKLTAELEWSLRMSAQPFSICYHRWSRSGCQHSGGTLQDCHHCYSGLDLDRQCYQWL